MNKKSNKRKRKIKPEIHANPPPPRAEINLAANATAYASGHHPGFEPSALNGLASSLDALATRRIKVAINGGALNPRGLAQRVAALAHEKGLDHVLRVAYVDGDDLRAQIGRSAMPSTKEEAVAWLPHLDAASAGEEGEEEEAGGKEEAFAFLRGGDGDGEGGVEGEGKGGAEGEEGGQPIVSANAYLGARGIATAFRHGADIVIAGRVADASPVVAAAWYWWGWDDSAYDALAGALVAGHLIECSAYVSGGNFAGFNEEGRYGGLETFLEPGFPIAEVDKDGACVVTKHEGTGGVVDVETVRCQLLYELQGNVYLHSDVKAVLDGVEVEGVGKDR